MTPPRLEHFDDPAKQRKLLFRHPHEILLCQTPPYVNAPADHA
jgi:hypothetical protein